MFKNKEIKYLKIKEGLLGMGLFIKYKNEQEEFLTNDRVDLEDFKLKQAEFYRKARAKVIEKARGWRERHNNYLRIKGRSKIIIN